MYAFMDDDEVEAVDNASEDGVAGFAGLRVEEGVVDDEDGESDVGEEQSLPGTRSIR